ncbi:MAG TPA: hypothetical protein VFS60_13320 [Thermoanaerobaculia bacterium]|nr:hypothetical protein [Thermoanaerobaculia bacterium]
MRFSPFVKASLVALFVVALVAPAAAAEVDTTAPAVSEQAVAAPVAETPAFLAAEAATVCAGNGALSGIANLAASTREPLAAFELTTEVSGAALGYCSVDCSRCATTSDCQRRGVGKCYPICP